MAVEVVVMWAARGAVRAIALHRGVIVQVAEDADGQDRWILGLIMRRCASLGIVEEIVPRRATAEDVAAWEAFCGKRRDIPPTTPVWRGRYDGPPKPERPSRARSSLLRGRVRGPRDAYTRAAMAAVKILGVRRTNVATALRLAATESLERAIRWADAGFGSEDGGAERSRCLSLAYRLLGDEETGMRMAFERCGGGKQGRAKRQEFVDRCSRNMAMAVAAVREILGIG